MYLMSVNGFSKFALELSNSTDSWDEHKEARHSISLNLSFLLCKVGLVTVPTS